MKTTALTEPTTYRQEIEEIADTLVEALHIIQSTMYSLGASSDILDAQMDRLREVSYRLSIQSRATSDETAYVTSNQAVVNAD